MASPAAGRGVPKAPPRDESGTNHPAVPACLEAQKWIEAVTGKSFGDQDFRSGLENGILLCELLSAIKPGLVKKFNRLPTPIAGLDNLSVFLRGCEELGLKGSQLFDPGDLQDTSIRANLKDSDCNRKIKNVLNTVFWLGKAASGCASYSGPTLNLKEFEGLLAQMQVDCEEGGDASLKRGVRDSGYDCWDSERSDSLSPPRHTRDNSLDSLDSFGSRSQHSPSPDVVNRGGADGRGSDSEADGATRRPDVRKDDMLARRTASGGDPRTSIPFNQFLPNRTNASSYIPTARRRPHPEEGEQRSRPRPPSEPSERTGLLLKAPKTVTWAPESTGEGVKQEQEEEEKGNQGALQQRRLAMLEKAGVKVLPAAVGYSSPSAPEGREVRSPPSNIILRCENDFLSSQKSAWDSSSSSSSDADEEAGARKVPDVRRDDLASRRARRGAVAPRVHQFVPAPACSSKDRERWEGIRRSSQQKEKEISEKDAVPDIIRRRDNPFLNSASRPEDEEDGEEEGAEGTVEATPNKQRDDLARRRGRSGPLPPRDGPVSLVPASMSEADVQKWQRLRMTEPSEASPAPVCRACLEQSHGSPFSGSAKAGRGHRKAVTFGGVIEIEQPVDTVTPREGKEAELLRRLLFEAPVAVPTIGLGSQLSERERSQVDAADLNQTAPPSAETPSALAELDARLAQYELRRDEEDDDEEDRSPDPRKDDMMARRTGGFHRQSGAAVTYNRFLPLPSAARRTPGGGATDAAPRNKRAVRADGSRRPNVREELQPPRVAMETTPPQHPDTTVTRATSRGECECEDDEDECGGNEPAADPEKDDMMARRTGSFQRTGSTAPVNRFLPVPGSVKYTIAPVSAMKPLHNRPKLTEKMASGSIVTVAAEPQAPLSGAPTLPKGAGLRERREEDATQEGGMTSPRSHVTDVTEPPPSLTPPSSPPRICKVEAELERQGAQERVEERMKDANGGPRRKAFWLDDDDLPPIMMSRRVAFMSEDTESVSMSDILNEEEVEHLPPLSQSRNERMHEPYNNFEEDDDHWQNDLARWKNRRRSASQELIKKEEERKRIEKRMKEEGSDGNKRKSIKTYKEIVEEKERREAELCDAYRNASSPEEAAMVLQRYALRFTISDATLDSLKLPRSTANPKQDTPEPPVVIKPHRHHKPRQVTEANVGAQRETPGDPVSDSQSAGPQSPEAKEPRPQPTPTTRPRQPAAGGAHTGPTGTARPSSAQPGHAAPSPPPAASKPVPLLAAKPYCPPRSTQPGHKAVKMEGLVRVNGATTEDLSVSTPPTSALHSPPKAEDTPPKMAEEDVSSEKTQKDVLSKQTEKDVLLEKTQNDVSLEETQKDDPLEKTQEDVFLEKTQEDVPLEKTQEDVLLEKTQVDVPLEETQKDVLLEETQKDVLLEETQKDVPLEESQKDVFLEETQKDVPLEESQKDVFLEETQKDVPLEETQKDVLLEETQKDVPLEESQKDVFLEETQKDVPLEETQKDVLLEETQKDVPLEETQKDVLLEETQKDVPIEETQKDDPLEETQESLSSEPLEQAEKDVPAKHSEKDVLPEHIPASRETPERTPPPQTERSTTSLGSAISSLIGGRNCTVTTTIVTELTHVEPHQPDIQSNAQLNGTSGLSESRVEEKKAPPASSPSSMQECSPTITATEGPEESSGTEQYQREQEKLKQEWEKAQVEVQEEERKHNEEERRILEETGTPLNPLALLSQQTRTTASPPDNNEAAKCDVTPQQNGQRSSAGSEDQHASKLHFFQESAFDGEPLKKQELWKTASLDRNPQLNPTHVAKRSESQDVVTNKQQPSTSSPQLPSPSRCVSGKRLCSGCSQQLEKGAAMIIDTLGLFFHIQCFKCGVCHGQLGDATAGTDVRIRNGLLSCHECYIASRGRGQPTTL
ncbi:LIM and calponin homology domains-containing protein 1-like isoform X2 [Pungitius pungitius]|uniref:LIM and calponin homology domains-containing protein 1-like isoform X2 n=1 Tax=Pungitius pungitius TaxID=134920 RepID=UPI002E14FBF5